MLSVMDRHTIETQCMAALAEARKARHHPQCFCRRFDGEWCNAADALWQRALNRCLQQLVDDER